MAVLEFRRNTYARNIYLYGTNSFQTVPTEYVEPIKQYAAATFSNEQIKNALDKGWITQQEYDDTMAIKYPAA